MIGQANIFYKSLSKKVFGSCANDSELDRAGKHAIGKFDLTILSIATSSIYTLVHQKKPKVFSYKL